MSAEFEEEDGEEKKKQSWLDDHTYGTPLACCKVGVRSCGVINVDSDGARI